jgi:hypothetical protein
MRELGDCPLAATPTGDTSYTALLRFARIEDYVPPGGVVTAAQLQLAFVNWGPETVDVQAYVMTRPRQHTKVGPTCAGRLVGSCAQVAGRRACSPQGVEGWAIQQCCVSSMVNTRHLHGWEAPQPCRNSLTRPACMRWRLPPLTQCCSRPPPFPCVPCHALIPSSATPRPWPMGTHMSRDSTSPRYSSPARPALRPTLLHAGPYPFPPTAPVEGSYLGCPDATCGGDRHVLAVGNATCLLYEAYRSMPPQPYGAHHTASMRRCLRPPGVDTDDAARLIGTCPHQGIARQLQKWWFSCGAV